MFAIAWAVDLWRRTPLRPQAMIAGAGVLLGGGSVVADFVTLWSVWVPAANVLDLSLGLALVSAVGLAARAFTRGSTAWWPSAAAARPMVAAFPSPGAVSASSGRSMFVSRALSRWRPGGAPDREDADPVPTRDTPGTHFATFAGERGWPGLASGKLLEDLPRIVLQLDASGVVRHANRYASQLLACGIPGTQAIPFADLVVSRDRERMLSDLQTAWEGATLDPSPCVLIRRDGMLLPVAAWFRRLRHDDGTDVVVAVILEADDQEGVGDALRHAVERCHGLEAQLRQAQKMEAIGQLTGGFAHDLNNVLTIILANADLISTVATGAADDISDELADLKHAARRGASMIRKLLAFSRRDALELRPLDLAEMVEEMLDMLQRLLPEHIDIQIKLTKGRGLVHADPAAIQQILMNIVTNARDAMPDGGRLEISTARVRWTAASKAQRGWGRPGIYMKLSVRDSGTGMDQTVLDRVFEPFFTTKPEAVGTGLGMSMIYGLVKQQGGYVEVSSAVGRGTMVDVFLPVMGARARPAVDFPKSQPQGGPETILIAEDEDIVRRSAQRMLTKYGYDVLVAEDGDAALEQYRERHGRIDLILSDVVMPRKGGPELYNDLRAAGEKVKFLFTSGYADDGRLDPAVPFLPKPWTLHDLLVSVRDVLDSRPLSVSANRPSEKP